MNSIGRFFFNIVNECWECTSHKPDRFGYSRALHNKVNTPVHRIVFEMRNGKIPKGKLILHSCDNPKCINPEHLSLGSIQDNMRDRQTRGRTNTNVYWTTGENNFQTNLKLEDVLEIRRLRNKLPQTVIAKMFGIGQTTVSGIQRGVYWKHVKGDLSGKNL